MKRRKGNIYGRRTAKRRMKGKRRYYISRGGIRL